MPVAYLITRGLGAYGGSVSAPLTPTLTVTDNGDGTGAVATISAVNAGDAISVLTSPWTTSAGSLTLTSKGTRTGNGTVALSLTNGTYLARARNTSGSFFADSTDYLITTTGPNTSEKYLESAFQFWLGQQPGVVELISNRIAGGILPEGEAYPAITFVRDDFTDNYSMAGESGIAMASLHVRCWARTPGAAKHVFERLRDCVAGFDGSWGNYRVTVFIGKTEDETMASPENLALQLFGVRAELTVWHEQNQTVS